MLESNIKEGKQTLTKLNYNSLLRGISITDGCISIEETEKIIKEAYSTILM
jgi:phospho-2-dehydro-3-deoxyheptonate aldolase